MAHFALGYTLYELDRFREAYRHLRYYTELAPAHPWNRCWFGKAAEAMGETEEARSGLPARDRTDRAGADETDADELLAELDGEARVVTGAGAPDAAGRGSFAPVEEEDRLRIEARAEQVLTEVPDWIWDGSTLPVPVEVIADSCFDLLVRDVELEEMQTAPDCPPLEEGSSLLGPVLAPGAPDLGQRRLEAREWPPRRRFTIGHELGHCVLHQDGQRALFCRHGSVDPAARRRERPPPRAPPPPPTLTPEQAAIEIEREANHFAAALLMPGELIRSHYQLTGGDFDALCRIFGSSRAAMGRRLHQAV